MTDRLFDGYRIIRSDDELAAETSLAYEANVERFKAEYQSLRDCLIRTLRRFIR